MVFANVLLFIVRGPHPNLTAPPIINPSVPMDKHKASSSVLLVCSFKVEDTAQFETKFIVTWFKVVRFIGGKSGRLVLFRQKTSQMMASIDYDTVDFSLGDTVSTNGI